MIWNRCGRTHLGPIPDNNRLKITKGLVGCLTHRDNPHGSSARHVQFQRELDEMIQEEGYFSNPTVERLCEIVARLILQREQTQQRFMAQSGTLGSSSSSSTLGKHPRYPKSTDTANKHTKATDNEEIPICQGCGRFGHRQDDPIVTSQHALYYCTYYSVSLTCIVHSVHHMFSHFPMLRFHLQHLFCLSQTSHSVHSHLYIYSSVHITF